MKVNRSDLWKIAQAKGKEIDKVSKKVRELVSPAPKNLDEVIQDCRKQASEILGRIQTQKKAIDFVEYKRGYEFAKKATLYPKEYMQTQILTAKATNNQSFLKGFKEAQKASDSITPLKQK